MTTPLIEAGLSFADVRPGDRVLLGGVWETASRVTVTITCAPRETVDTIDVRVADVPDGVAFFEGSPDTPITVQVAEGRVAARLLSAVAAVQESLVDRDTRRTG